jgi:hypothetical protein
MMIQRNGHWYAIELPVPMLIALVPLLCVVITGLVACLR